MTYSIWCEGFATTEGSAPAIYLGRSEGENLKDACERLAESSNEFATLFDPERMTYWGCRIFDNAADAAKSFGQTFGRVNSTISL